MYISHTWIINLFPHVTSFLKEKRLDLRDLRDYGRCNIIKLVWYCIYNVNVPVIVLYHFNFTFWNTRLYLRKVIEHFFPRKFLFPWALSWDDAAAFSCSSDMSSDVLFACVFTADPPPYIDGIRINSPHYLTKIKLTSPGTHTFTLVVSQYEKQNTINYTLRVSGPVCVFV